MRINYVLTPLFVLALVLLLLNDFVLKSAFSNFLTGKLSDLAGIVVLALFLTAFFPKQKLIVYSFVILAFAFWKSPLSDFLITFLNDQFSAGYSRVVDFTDLLCLLALIPLYRFQPREKPKMKRVFVPLSALTLFALVATSRAEPPHYGYAYVGKEITFESSKENFLNVLTAHNIPYKMTYKYEHKGDSMETYELQKFLIGSDTIYSATISLKQPNPNQVVVSLHNIRFTDGGRPARAVNYANQDSVVEVYRTRTVNYFENLKQKN